MDAKLQAWASRIKDTFDREMEQMRDQNKELEYIVSRLTRHITSLELKIDHVGGAYKAEPKRLENDLNKLDEKFTSQIQNIKSFCGFSDDLPDDYTPPEYNMNNRLDNVEIFLDKVNSDVKRMEKRTDTEERYHQCHFASPRRGRGRSRSPQGKAQSRRQHQHDHQHGHQHGHQQRQQGQFFPGQQQQHQQSEADLLGGSRGQVTLHRSQEHTSRVVLCCLHHLYTLSYSLSLTLLLSFSLLISPSLLLAAPLSVALPLLGWHLSSLPQSQSLPPRRRPRHPRQALHEEPLRCAQQHNNITPHNTTQHSMPPILLPSLT
jgi:hypothetical protein